jgi:hypothetical protein
MNIEENRHAPLPEDRSPTNEKMEQKIAALREPGSAKEKPFAWPRVEPSDTGVAAVELELSPEVGQAAAALRDIEGFKDANGGELRPEPDEVLSPSADREPEPAELTPSIAAVPAPSLEAKSYFREQPPQLIKVDPLVLRQRTRREFLLFGAGTLAALAGAASLLPQATLDRLGFAHAKKTWPQKDWFLNKALRIDDDVAEALYSKDRLVPTYTKSQITPLRNNYNGATPDPSYIPEWQLELNGLASGLRVSLNIRNLLTRFQVYEQITRFVCVEGWSAIA